MIEHFKSDEYKWLSNFEACKIILDGIEYKSVEHAYMSAKSDDPAWKKFCETEPKSNKVKIASRDLKLKDNWVDIKVSIMRECIDQKFDQAPLKEKLLNTGKKYIQEGNWHNDSFWGVDLKVDPPIGHNMLGKLLMEKRNALLLEHLI